MSQSRHISFLDAFEPEGCFEEFTKLVRNKKNELALLFRGNSGDNGEAIIYYRNNVMFKLSRSSRNAVIRINYNHLRYTNDWPDEIKKFNKFGFPLKTKNDIKPENNYGIGYVSAVFSLDSSKERLNDVYVNGLFELSKSVMCDFFSDKKTVDCFRDSLGVPQTGRKKNDYLEKREQQAYFMSTSNLDNGLFVYDLEYKQPFHNKEEKGKSLKAKKRKAMNKPDCLGIRFKEQKPVSFALVEMKSKIEAESGKSGTSEHLDGMMDDLNDDSFVHSRLEEANQIIQDYKTLKLKELTDETTLPDIMAYEEQMGREIIVVYTDASANGKTPGKGHAESKKYENGIDYTIEIFHNNCGSL